MPRILNIIASINRRFSTTKSIPKSKFATKFAIGCGIVGFVGNEPAQDYIFEGLHILRSRGYDSAGITTISENPKTCSNPKQSLDQSSNGFNKKTANHSLKTTKFASINVSDSFDLVKKAAQSIHSKNFCGIGHTRWATHGGKTDINAHPHTDQHNRIAVVHNGTIENFAVLKKELQSENYRFVSDTDTEVIAQLISFFYDSEQKNLVAAVRIAASKLQGTYGLAILCRDLPGRIIAV
ncbi:hypothetical protein MHBO_001365 [Bonamia ostreae]|uniref:glutamine--fructose-6-phosphate transaminase (isomerizing) n=1 Tax=Bonamia ostreae TaxID=126728 RepID=A0ABV2AIP9_9EUKA